MPGAAVHTVSTDNGGWRSVVEERFVPNRGERISSRTSCANDPYPPEG